jgi:tRNA(Ile)-lysidine synthase
LRFGAGEEKKFADYEYALPVPGSIAVPEVGSRFESVLISNKGAYNPEHLLNQALLGKELRVRNWRPGDRFRPPHTKAVKKIKELLQERHLTGIEKASWPVVVSGDDVIWVRGFATPVALQANEAAPAALIREIPFHSKD